VKQATHISGLMWFALLMLALNLFGIAFVLFYF
jgi:hypothetical protein